MTIANKSKDMMSKIDKVEIKFRAEAEAGVSNENYGSTLTTITNFFSNGLEGINNIFKSIKNDTDKLNANEFNSSISNIISLESELRQIVESGKVKLTDVGGIQVPVILGLKLNILETVNKLSSAVKNIEDNLEDVIKETDEMIGKTLASKDYRTSSRPPVTKTNIRSKAFDLMDVVSDIIDTDGTKDRMKLNVFLPSLNSVIDINNEIVKFNKILGTDFITNIQKELNKLTERSEILYKYIKQNEDVTISNAVLHCVADRLDFTARYATNITSIIYITKHSLESYLVCLNSIKEYYEKRK